MNKSAKVAASSLLIGFGFFMAHFLIEAIAKDDFRILVGASVIFAITCLVGLSVGFIRVKIARLTRRTTLRKTPNLGKSDVEGRSHGRKW
jgi:NhaP-type Na+/H+ or K+/H+ antiporter